MLTLNKQVDTVAIINEESSSLIPTFSIKNGGGEYIDIRKDWTTIPQDDSRDLTILATQFEANETLEFKLTVETTECNAETLNVVLVGDQVFRFGEVIDLGNVNDFLQASSTITLRGRGVEVNNFAIIAVIVVLSFIINLGILALMMNKFPPLTGIILGILFSIVFNLAIFLVI